MTKQKINIIIAEACGWKCKKESYHVKPPNGQWEYMDKLPDYCSDLNAMHMAMLAHPHKYTLREFLYLEVMDDPRNIANEPAWATAEQWARAYVRSIGKWEE